MVAVQPFPCQHRTEDKEHRNQRNRADENAEHDVAHVLRARDSLCW